MSFRRAVGLSFQAALVFVVVALVAGQILGTPVLFGYVETGSMTGTLNPGDGFIAIPAALAGDVETGDVVTFRAQEVGGGGLTTHRVVRETPQGYYTQGDANPFTDQAGGEPVVKDAQVVAVALQVNGRVVRIPHLGTGITSVQNSFEDVQRRLAVMTGSRAFLGTRGLSYLLLALSVMLYGYDVLASRSPVRERERTRDRGDGFDSGRVLLVLAAVIVVTATAAMVVPAGTQSFGVVSAEFESDSPTVIRAGESSTLPYTVGNGGLIPVVAYVEPASNGVSISQERLYVDGRSTARTNVTLSAPPDTGYYRRFVTEHRYLAVLPGSVIDGLHDVHPWLPIVVIDALLGGGLYLIGYVLLRGRRVRLRTRESRHDRSLFDRMFD
ncbi:S26 family signal peptidase [Salarchaeum japonicum]|uniref:S26 family signal peptidase n=1 Tax=Salarchaeum japonicum TaxID=555573 RepID=UPI003C70F25A